MFEKILSGFKEHATKIVNYGEKDMIPLTTGERKLYSKQKVWHICKKGFSIDAKEYQKVGNHCHYTVKYRGASHNICNLIYKMPEEISVVFHNGSKYN